MKKPFFVVMFALMKLTQISAQKIPIPNGFSLIKSVVEDLDKDSVNELVAAYNTRIVSESSSENIPRMLVIYKKDGVNWTP